MAAELATMATLGLTVQNITATAKANTAAIVEMGDKGVQSADRLRDAHSRFASSLSPLEQAIEKTGRSSVEAAANYDQSVGALGRAGRAAQESGAAFESLEHKLGHLGVAGSFAFTNLAEGSEQGLTRLAHSLALFGGAFGPEGLLITTFVAVAGEKLIDWFQKAREEAVKTDAAFQKSIGDMANAADASGINVAARKLLYGTPFDEAGGFVGISTRVAGAFKGSLADMEAEFRELSAKIPKDAAFVTGEIGRRYNELVPKLNAARESFQNLQLAANNLQSQPSGTPGLIGGITSSASTAKASLDDLFRAEDRVREAQQAFALVGVGKGDAGQMRLDQQLYNELLVSTRTLKGDALKTDTDSIVAAYKINVAALQLNQTIEHQAALKKGINDADTAAIAAQKAADDEAKRVAETIAQEDQKYIAQIHAAQKASFDEMDHRASQFFQNIYEHGIKSFSDLFNDAKSMFLKMLADMEAADLVKRFGPSMAGFFGLPGGKPGGLSSAGIIGASLGGIAGTGALGYGAGYGIGASTGSGAIGALGGAASGALIGNTLLPGGLGAGIGAIAGLAGGILGAGSAARQAAEQMKQLRKELEANVESLRHDAGLVSDLDYAKAQLHDQIQTLKDQTDADFAGKKNEEERNRRLAELNQLEQTRIQQLTEEAAAQDRLAKMNAAKTLIDSLTGTITTLSQFRNSLALGDLSTLSPVQKLAEAKRQYDAVKSGALAGDQNAADQYTTAAQAYLAASRAVNASGVGYAATFNQVNADSAAIQKIFEDQRSIQQKIYDELVKLNTGSAAGYQAVVEAVNSVGDKVDEGTSNTSGVIVHNV